MRRVDLHLHSNASDGEFAPAVVTQRAVQGGLAAIALTDHDTVSGVSEAVDAAAGLNLDVVAGCEFSVRARWGEMHVLGYFVPLSDPRFTEVLQEERAKRATRAERIVQLLNRAGVSLDLQDVLEQAAGGAVGRPHVARALVKRGCVRDIDEAFVRFLSRRRPAFVPKQLPSLAEVTALVRSVGGVTSAAHLGARATATVVREMRDQGVDAIEVLHPAHDEVLSGKLREWALRIGMLLTGGSDWHGGSAVGSERAAIGSQQVPESWLEALAELHHRRR